MKQKPNEPERAETSAASAPADAGESNAARILRLHGDNREAELTAAAEAAAPVRPASRVENFWYHHKWTVIIVGSFLIIFGIATYQLLSRVTPDDYVMYAGPAYVSSSTSAALQSAFAEWMDDENGDGKKETTFYTLVYAPEGANLSTAMTQFRTELSAGDSGVYFLSPYLYQIALEAGLLVPLAEVLDEIPAGAADEYSVTLSETVFYQRYECARALPADTRICLRQVTALSTVRGGKKAQTQYEAHCRFFRKLLTLTPPTETD